MKLKIGFLFLLMIFLFSACSIERKLALEFLRHAENKGVVLVVPPYSLEMYNNNEYNFDSVSLPDNFPLNEFLFQQTRLLKQVSDSVFLENYLNSFIDQLNKRGFLVYLPGDLDAFRNAPGPHYVFKLAQLELAESYYPYLVEEKIGKEEFRKAFELNMVTLQNWFEFEAVDTTWQKVFYAENSITDEFNGEFITDNASGKLVYYYAMDSLAVKDVYQMADDVGYLYAGYLADYLMNSFIEQHYPKEMQASQFFHYDISSKMLFPFEGGFEEVSKPQ